ncbi:MAG TPA: hypothetical protein VHG69_00040 [Thermoleophilaceae bacterium]|nr:hypothetical protein [Thermoleophilaceae bacterium]
MPSRDVAADRDQLVERAGATPVFAIEAFGARVAMVALGDGPPPLLLADHLEGERPVFVYRVPDLDRAMAELESRGVDPGPRFGIPHGPCCSFAMAGGHRIALYERTRPQADERFAGRHDF